MEKLIILPKGITTTAQPEPGDSYNLVNLRLKNGALQPVAPRKMVKQLNSMYDKIFLHRLPSGQENMIGVRNTSIYFDIDNTPVLITDSLPGVVFSIQQIGNTISLMCEDAIHYLLWKGTSYVNLGVLPDLPVIKISTEAGTDLTKLYKDEYPADSTYDPAATNKDNFELRTKAMGGKMMDEANEEDMMFYDAFFVRYAFKMFDGNYMKHSAPILVMPPWSYVNGKMANIAGSDRLLGINTALMIKRFQTRLISSLSHLSSWSDIILSVDVFISPALGLTAFERAELQRIVDPIEWQVDTWTSLLTYNFENAKDGIITESKFYKILELLPGESNILFPSNTDHKNILKTLIGKTTLPDDPFLSHHKPGSKKSYTYNNRLHVFDIKTSLFRGFYLSNFVFESFYNGGIIESGSLITRTIAKVYFSDNAMPVVIAATDSIISSEGALSGFISYPDTRATKIELFVQTSVTGRTPVIRWNKLTFTLTPHDILNISYYFQLGLIDLYPEEGIEFVDAPTSESTNQINAKQYPLINYNTLKVSDVNNPFRLSRTYSFDSEILNIASNTIKSSDFGQFPLYVFTRNRIFAMQIGSGDIAYSNTVIISNDQPISDKILSTPYGVFYITQRGLKSVGSPEIFTKSNEESRRLLTLDQINIAGDPFQIDNAELRDVLNDPNLLMLYNPHEDEIIFQGEKTFVLGKGQIFKLTDKFDGVVENAYPDVKLIRYLPKVGDTITYPGQSEVKIACILKEGDAGYEAGKIKGYVFLPFDYQFQDNYNAYTPEEDFYFPTVENISLIVEGGLSGSLQGAGAEIWLAENNDDPGDGVPVFSTFDNTISYLYPYESELRSVLLVKLIEIPTPYNNTFIYDLAQSEGEAKISLTTRPINFGTPLYKRLERAVFRCQLISATNVYGMIHGSIDNKYFKALKGIKFDRTEGVTKPLNYKDLDLGMTTNKFKSYVFSLAATVEEDSVIEMIEAEVQQEYNNDKIR